MARTPTDLSEADVAFLAERHLGTLTTLRADGRPHVVAIAFAFDPSDGLVRIITSDATQKVRNTEERTWAAVCQVDGRRWLTLEGRGRIGRTPEQVSRAVAAFEGRYRPVSENPRRVAIEIEVDRILGRA